MYTTPFGPIVDGVVIPDQPLDILSQKGHANTFAKYDVMFGLTQSEAFHLFPASLGKSTAQSPSKKSPAMGSFFQWCRNRGARGATGPPNILQNS